MDSVFVRVPSDFWYDKCTFVVGVEGSEPVSVTVK